jgi:UDP-galactopyranose mutase
LTLHKLVTRELRDDRLRLLALPRVQLDGHEPRNVPAWEGVWSYVEQNFGAWTLPGGMGQLTDVLTRRLETRGVTVLTTNPARDLVVEGGRVRAVRIDEGTVEADIVVCAIDPRRLPALAPFVARTMPAIPPTLCHLGVVGDVPELPAEVVLHGDPTLVLRPTGTAPAGAHAWTVLGRGRLAEDIVTALHRAGIRVRDQVEVRVDRSPRELVEEWNGSPLGVLWQGRGTLTHRLGTTTPIEGVFMAGAHTTPGAGLPSVGLSAALVAQVIGPA